MLLTGGALALLLGLYYYWLAKDKKISYGKQVAEAFPRIKMGIACVYCIRFSMRAGFLLSLFYDLLDGYLINDMSFSYVVLPILLISAYGAMHGREKRLRTMELLFWFVAIPFLIVMLCLMKDVEIAHFQEIVEGTEAVKHKALGMFYPLALFSNVEFILFLVPKIRENDRSLRNLIIPVTLAVVCNFILMFLVVGVIGFSNCAHLNQPVIRVLESMNLPGAFVRRLDIFVLAFWICAVFGVLSGCIFYSGRLLRDNVRHLKERTFYPWELLVVIALVYIASLWWRQFQDVFTTYIGYSLWIDIPLGMVLAFLTVYKNKRRRYKKWRKWLFTGVIMCGMVVTVNLFSGCSQMKDVEDWDYVLTLGVDEGGYTFGMNDGEKAWAEYVQAATLQEAIEQYEKHHANSIELGHVVAVIVGESVWRETKGNVPKESIRDKSTTEQTTEQQLEKDTQAGERKQNTTEEQENARYQIQLTSVSITATNKVEQVLKELDTHKDISISTSIFAAETTAQETLQLSNGKKQTIGEYVTEIYANNQKEKQKQVSLHYILQQLADNQKKQLTMIMLMDVNSALAV